MSDPTIIAHTPDPAKYHAAPGNMTMLPRATGMGVDGVSMGFDHTKAQRTSVHVGGNDDTGVREEVFDFDPQFAAAHKDEIAHIMSTVGPLNQQENVLLAYRRIAEFKESLKNKLPAAVPRAHVTSALKRAAVLAAPQPFPSVASAVEPAVAAVTPINTATHFNALELRMDRMTEAITAMLQKPEEPIQPAAVLDLPIEANVDHYNIDFLSPAPARANVQVIFNFGKSFGQLMTRYHAAIEGEGCLVLVYDTRYEDGMQFTPPVSDGEDQDTGKMTVIVQTGKTRKRYEVASLGLQFRMGCLDLIVLVVAAASAAASTSPASAQQWSPPPAGGEVLG